MANGLLFAQTLDHFDRCVSTLQSIQYDSVTYPGESEVFDDEYDDPQDLYADRYEDSILGQIQYDT